MPATLLRDATALGGREGAPGETAACVCEDKHTRSPFSHIQYVVQVLFKYYPTTFEEGQVIPWMVPNMRRSALFTSWHRVHVVAVTALVQ